MFMRTHLAPTLLSLAAAAMLAMSLVFAAPGGQFSAAFGEFIAAQNAHDLKRVGAVLVESPDFLWIAPGQTVRGRDAALKRFGELFQGTWRVDPDWSTFQVMMLDVSTAEVFALVKIADGTATRSVRVNQILVHTGRAWRVSSVVFANALTD
jgi:ketosteroid isomerase-like protein